MEITVNENDVVVSFDESEDIPGGIPGEETGSPSAGNESGGVLPDDGESVPGGESETPGGDSSVSDNTTPGSDGGSGGNAEPVTPAPSETPGGGETSGGDETAEKLDSVLESLDLMKQKAGEESPVSELTDALKELIVVMSPGTTEPETPVLALPVLPDGYQDYRYPIEVQVEVQEKGAQYSMCMGFCCTQPSQFADEVADLTSKVESGEYLMARIQYVYATGDDGKANVLVYDYEHVVTPEEPETPDEPTETEKTTVELLEAINTELQAIRENDIAYREETLLLQKEVKVLQTQSLASSIALGMCVFLGVGYMVGHGFWSRMKVG